MDFVNQIGLEPFVWEGSVKKVFLNFLKILKKTLVLESVF